MKDVVFNTVLVFEQPGIYHIPGVHNMQNTLCGFVDALHEEVDCEDHPCNCNSCIDAWKRIKALKFERGYFAQ